MRISALGYVITIIPDFIGNSGKWTLVMVDGRGDWNYANVYENKDEARKARTKLFKHHRKMKREERQTWKHGKKRSG